MMCIGQVISDGQTGKSMDRQITIVRLQSETPKYVLFEILDNHKYIKSLYLHFEVFLPLITLRINFVLYNP